MIMWAAPIGAFGAIAAVVGETGWSALRSLAVIMVGFYATCLVFIFVVLGSALWLGARVNIVQLLRYLAREFLLIVSTSSSESALPRLIAKMEHLGVSKPVVGITVPTGYSFNLDGTAIYLTMATLFVAAAQGSPLSVGAQISLLVFMIIASKGAAGVSGAGIATLAGGLQSHRPELVDGVGFILGIDRFMSEARCSSVPGPTNSTGPRPGVCSTARTRSTNPPCSTSTSPPPRNSMSMSSGSRWRRGNVRSHAMKGAFLASRR
jgi:aerobic C4-dicarboxylate transport protein